MPIFDAGTALGGTRPKASVRETDGGLWLAKFPGVNDSTLTPEIEAAALYMARQCGMRVPTTRVVLIGEQPVMLIERFDRYWSTATAGLEAERKEYRLGFDSALTFLGCTEQENGQKSYANIAQTIHRYVAFKSITTDCEKLFRRMVFNIFVTNDDDHLRNHAFLFDADSQGWRLSPLYDVVPRPVLASERRLHLGVGEQGKLATLDNALSHHAAFVPQRPTAVGIMRRVWGEVRQWKTCFEELGADGRLIDQLTHAFREISEIASPALEAEIRGRRQPG